MLRRLLLFTVLLFPAMLLAADARYAQRWLEESDRLESEYPQGGGVYSQYESVQLRLVQALSWAAQGDTRETLKHLPFAATNDDDWLSGGDGMVRQLVIGDALRHVHGTLFEVLAYEGRADDALAYIEQLTAQQKTPDLYFELAYRLPGLKATSKLTAIEQAQFGVGRIRGVLAVGEVQAARQLMSSLDPEFGREALDQQARLLMLQGDTVAAADLYRIATEAGYSDASNLLQAISMAVQAGQLDTARHLLDLLGPAANDAHLVHLALGYAAQEDIEQARQVFHAVKLKRARSWETVAIMIGEDDWLANHYESLEDPWRRAERFFQLAKRQLLAGNLAAAQHNASLALAAAEQVPGASTRALAFQLLAEFHALAGEPARVSTLIDLIGDDEALQAYHEQATRQLALAWAVTGNVQKARTVATSIEAAVPRIQALTGAAGKLRLNDQAGYEALIEAARDACKQPGSDAAAGEAWALVVATQISAGDLAGARTSADAAVVQGAAMPAWQQLVEHHLSIGEFAHAQAATMKLPEDASFTRQKALAEIVKVAAAAGDLPMALQLVESINQVHIRELSLPPVIRALVESGRAEDASRLLAGITRRDVRQDALSVLLYQQALTGALPAVELLNAVPPRGGAGFCWAAVAAVKVAAAELASWLQQLEQPRCQAFAYAGAAYAASRNSDPAFVFGLVDPSRVSEKMATAMQRSAIIQQR